MIRSSVVLPAPFAPTSAARALADPERDVVQQHPPVGKDDLQLLYVNVTHAAECGRPGRGARTVTPVRAGRRWEAWLH